MQLSISSDLEHLILEKAQALGFSSAESYLRALLRSANSPRIAENIALEEFDNLLDELASEPVPTLPADFSRADIYGEHP